MNNLKLLSVSGALIGMSLLPSAMTSDKGTYCVSFASDLIGMKVISEKGDSLGKIEDIVVHPGGAPSYAVLSFGGWMGMDEKLFAMPWSVLRAVEADSAKKDSARSLVLPLDKERLKTAPGFDKKNWPTLADRDWTQEVDAYYRSDLDSKTKKPVEAASRPSVITWRATELKGMNVESPKGEKLGDLKELAIDSNGRVCYVALSVGGFLGMGDRVVAVPWDSMTFSLGGDKGDKKLITLASTKKQLEEAPQFKAGKENGAEMCNPKWIGRVYDYYSCPVYWKTTEDSEVKQSAKN